MGNASEPRDIDERIGWIKASISSRVDELGRRVERVRGFTDIQAAVTRHPWVAVGAGFAVGLIVAASRARRDDRTPGFLATSLRAMLVTVATSYARVVAREWIEKQLHPDRAHAHGVAQPLTQPARESRGPVH